MEITGFQKLTMLASPTTRTRRITTANLATTIIPVRASFTRLDLYPRYPSSSSVTTISHQNNTQTNPNSRNHSSPFLIHCLPKPDLDSNSATDSNPSIEGETDLNTAQLQFSASSQSQKPSSASRGLVFDLGPLDSWDDKEIGSPVVKRFLGDEEERWYMWYHGNSAQTTRDSIGLAVSNNGIHWERGTGGVNSTTDVGLVMNCSKDWWAFDTEGIRPSEIVIMSSTKVRASSAVYWLYYTGYNAEEIEFSVAPKIPVENPDRKANKGVLRSLPGLAISQDGRHWARIEGEHHSGALFDVGSDTEWDSLFIAAPRVVYHKSGDLRMYYHSFDAQCGQPAVGIARSRDGIRWVKLGKILDGGTIGSFDEFGVMNAHVMRNPRNGGYLMAYEGVAADGQKNIGLAASPDGLKDWKRWGSGAVLKPSVEDDGWDNERVEYPCLVQMDGDSDQWRLYYRGVGKGGRTGIGMAVSEGSEVNSFKRWAGFHL